MAASAVVFHSPRRHHHHHHHHDDDDAVSQFTTPAKLPVYEPLCLPDYVPRSAPGVEHFFSKHEEDALYSPFAVDVPTNRPASANSPRTAKGQPAKSPSKANHAKLHKKRYPNPAPNYTIATSRPRSRRRTDASSGSNSTSSDPSILTSLSETSTLDDIPHPPPHSSRSPTRERLKNNLRMFGASKDDDLALDMSQTAEENAGRLGLAIGSSCPASPLMGVSSLPSSSSSSSFKVHNHGRSRSQGSVTSLNSSLFRPTAPFSFNMPPPPPQPYAVPRVDSYVSSSQETESIIRAMEESRAGPMLSQHAEQIQEEQEEEEGDEAAANDLDESQPPSLVIDGSSTPTPKSESPPIPSASLSKATTLESRSWLTSSNSDLRSRHRSLSRRSTDTSEIGSPRSTSSFSFRPKIKEDAIDPVKRAATIAAARRAFAEREQEKTRKYEDRLRKAAEKQQRRQQRQKQGQEQEHASPSSSSSLPLPSSYAASSSSSPCSSAAPSRKASLEDVVDDDGGSGALCGREYSELTPVPSNALPTKIQTINLDAIRRPSKKKGKATTGTRKKNNPRTKKKQQQSSASSSSNSSRRFAKGIYVRSFLWLKMRMLNLARKNGKK